jgi:CheY-like chemotaxis protein
MPEKTILLIDDEPDIARMIQITLTALVNWQVLIAESGEAGIPMAINHQPDAILLDMMMPGMSGREVFQQLQQSTLTASIPVIFLTAKLRKNMEHSYADLSISGFIPKPFNAAELPSQISRILNWEQP